MCRKFQKIRKSLATRRIFFEMKISAPRARPDLSRGQNNRRPTSGTLLPRAHAASGSERKSEREVQLADLIAGFLHDVVAVLQARRSDDRKRSSECLVDSVEAAGVTTRA
jgi:hypothetical protein